MKNSFRLCALPLALTLAGCADMPNPFEPKEPPTPPQQVRIDRAPGQVDAPAAPVVAQPETPAEVAAVVDAPPPSPAATTVAQLDTTTEAQKAAATAAPQSVGARLGTAQAALGDPTDPGLWLKTGLVSSPQPGRVQAANGQSVLVELRPVPGDGGPTMSLAAMQALQVPLTDIPVVTVYAQ
ncbi:D-galactarate dehydratase [Palleronia caenipelagi]|uniref:D-galactarate dehydratase n=1 Tax=Palleronia caenipelagi TaxID=2489174 RepID=A0A547PQL9_9RHOB|nr:D-galactarate dehydratase [Palleronia caenipelagi]TRD16438.1 D-galactarate dehydratase [Palleronia caenipelagi]